MAFPRTFWVQPNLIWAQIHLHQMQGERFQVVTRVVDTISELIANTPLLRLNRFARDLPCEVIGKLESFNPGWSVKDRIGLAMIDQAEKNGELKPGGTIIEPTSGKHRDRVGHDRGGARLQVHSLHAVVDERGATEGVAGAGR